MCLDVNLWDHHSSLVHVCGMLGRVKVWDVGTRGASRLADDPCALTRASSESCPDVAPSDSHLSHEQKKQPISDLRNYWEPVCWMSRCESAIWISLLRVNHVNILLLEAHFRQLSSFCLRVWFNDGIFPHAFFPGFLKKFMTCSPICEVAIYERFTTPDINTGILRQFIFWSVCCISLQIALPSSAPPAVVYSLKNTWWLLNNTPLTHFLCVCLFILVV